MWSCYLEMRLLCVSVLVLCAALAACQPSDTLLTPTPVATAIPSSTTEHPPLLLDGTLQFTAEGVTVDVPRPSGWETFTTDRGVVMAERFASVADHGKQLGLLAYVFVTPLDAYPLAVEAARQQNLAQRILNDIAAVPDTRIRESTVTGFRWGKYDAAYYLTTEPGTDMQTLVIAVAMPDGGVLLTCALSAPRTESARIRSALPTIFGGLRLNTRAVGEADLYMLPQALVFPE